MSVRRLGQRREVILPKRVCDEVGLQRGDFVEVQSREDGVLLRPAKRLVADDTLTREEARIVRKGERQLRRGQYSTLRELLHELDRKARPRRRKSTGQATA